LLPCAANDAEGVHEEGRGENECDDGKEKAAQLPDPGRDLNSSRRGDARSEDHLEQSAAIERESWGQIVEHQEHICARDRHQERDISNQHKAVWPIGSFRENEKEYSDQGACERARHGNDELLRLVGWDSAEPGDSSHAVQGRFEGFYFETFRGEKVSEFVEKDANELEEYE
jgi:hypothetical protein